MEYGVITIREAYHSSKLASKTTEIAISKMISEKAQALTEVMEALNMVVNGETCHATIEIMADPGGKLNRIVVTKRIKE